MSTIVSIDRATEETVLFRMLRDAEPEQRERIREELVRRHEGLVRWLAARYNNPAVDFGDLVQVGYLGLVLAINRFDPDRGSDFVSFARPTVQGEIRRWFRDKRRWIRLPRKVQEAKMAMQAATDTLTQQLGRAPTVTELAAHMEVDEELVLEALTVDDGFAPRSLDAGNSHDPDAQSPAELIGATDGRFEVVIDRLSVRPLLAALPERDRRILYLRFFQDLTQAEIAGILGLSQMHVSRLLSSILTQLRAKATAEATTA